MTARINLYSRQKAKIPRLVGANKAKLEQSLEASLTPSSLGDYLPLTGGTVSSLTVTSTLTADIIKVGSIKSGATQGAAGAVANELWKTASHATLPDNVILIGV